MIGHDFEGRKRRRGRREVRRVGGGSGGRVEELQRYGIRARGRLMVEEMRLADRVGSKKKKKKKRWGDDCRWEEGEEIMKWIRVGVRLIRVYIDEMIMGCGFQVQGLMLLDWGFLDWGLGQRV